MVRGIGNPLVAWYARCYLCRIGVSTKLNINYFEESFKDILLTYKQVTNKLLYYVGIQLLNLVDVCYIYFFKCLVK